MNSSITTATFLFSLFLLSISCTSSISDEEKIISAHSIEEINQIISVSKDEALIRQGKNRIELLQFVTLLKTNSASAYSSYQNENPNSPYFSIIEYIQQQEKEQAGKPQIDFTDTSFISIYHHVERIDDFSRDLYVKAFENYLIEAFSPFSVEPIFIASRDEFTTVKGPKILLSTRTGVLWNVHEETGQTHNPEIINIQGSIVMMEGNTRLKRYDFDFETGLTFAVMANSFAEVIYNKGNKLMDSEEMQKFWNFFLLVALRDGESDKNKYRIDEHVSFSPQLEELISSYYSHTALFLQFLNPDTKAEIKLTAHHEIIQKDIHLDASLYEILTSFTDFDFPALQEEINKQKYPPASNSEMKQGEYSTLSTRDL